MITSDFLKTYLSTLLGPNGDLAGAAPELALCATIIVLLLGRHFVSPATHLGPVAFVGTLSALWITLGQWAIGSVDVEPVSRELFGGMLVYDLFTIYIRMFLLFFTGLLIILSLLTGIPDAEDSVDFYTLLLGGVLGMSLMASANHLLMVFLAVEMSSIPSYAMAGFLKGRRQSSEAALKYVVYGGAAAGVMLYGISLLAGLYGAVHLPTLAKAMAERFAQDGGAFEPTLLLALVLILAGLAFKLSAFPFHFWCPDVFEGAAAEVAAFLSVASKGAAVALAARFSLTLAGTFHSAIAEGASDVAWGISARAIATYLGPTIAVLAALTATFGNLAAFGQTNIKRLLAYSTIAHAGYMLMALATLSLDGARAAIFYLLMYLLMNLGAFAVVAFVRNQTRSEELEAYTGLVYRAPWLGVAMCVFLLSLIGVPPFGGFVGKFQIFYALYDAYTPVTLTLLVIGAVNSVLSLVYYGNVIRVMVLLDRPEGSRSGFDAPLPTVYVMSLAAGLVYFGIFWSVPDAMANFSASSLRPARVMTVDSTAPSSSGALAESAVHLFPHAAVQRGE